MAARIFTLSVLLSWFMPAVAQPQEPAQDLVLAFDRETAQLLPPQNVLGVLVHDKNETYETINARALAMRHATHFVYTSGQGSSLASIYRERLQAQGLVVIELPKAVKRQKSPAVLMALRSP